MLYLGIGASAICFLTWNFATKYLGVVKTTVYIYACPVVTVITAYLVLNEPITLYKFNRYDISYCWLSYITKMKKALRYSESFLL